MKLELSCSRYQIHNRAPHSYLSMIRQQISKDVKDFISKYIRSVFEVEVLLLLHRTTGKLWLAHEVGQELGIETGVANIQLMTLAEMDLLTECPNQPDCFIYNPANEELAAVIDNLAVAYEKQRVAIFSLILKRPDNRMQRFAEAFRLIKGED
jgi:hypothetical protein